MPNLTGQSIGRYHILEQLGEGGMATVYKAYDTRLERNVAVKVLRTDLFGSAIIEQILKRFEREAKSLAKLKHPNIVNILDFGEHEGMPYLVMEYLPGGTLKQKLGQAIPWQEAIQTLLPVARGLSYAHQHGVIHRDVKPANILIDQNEEPILTDFGIAKLLEGTEGHTLTGSGVGIGTPEYMAPEQGIGAHTIDARADIYSLGIVLYEMVTGRKPYVADTPMAVVLKQMTDPLPRPTEFVPDLPEEVEHILFKALAKQPTDRYEDMNALIVAMEGALGEAQKVQIPAPAKQVKRETKQRARLSSRVVWAVIGILGTIVIIVLSIMIMPRVGGYFSPAAANTPNPTATRTTKSTTSPTSTPTGIPQSTPITTPDLRILNPINQHLYLYVRTTMGWLSARNYCVVRGGHLVTIQNSSENEFVSELISNDTWLGATDMVEEGKWLWVTGEDWKFTSWDRGEPNNANDDEDYLELPIRLSTTMKWNDVGPGAPLYQPKHFICEWEPAITSGDTEAFYKPILSYLTEGHITFQDDFSTSDKYNSTEGFWEATNVGSMWPEDGYRLVKKNEPTIEMTFPELGQFNATDFAIQYDAAFVRGTPLDGFGVYFRASSNLNINYKFLFSSADKTWRLSRDDGTTLTELESGSSVLDPYEFNTFLIVVKQENLAIFLNGNLIAVRNDIKSSGIYNLLVATAQESQRQLKLDNVKFWNLNGVDFR